MEYFPISKIADLTGIPPITLRAWERRYGMPKPRRTASGHRLYGMDEVVLIQRVTSLMASGYTVSRAMERLRLERETPQQVHNEPAGTGERWQNFRERMIAAVDRFDTAALEAAYSEPLTLFPIDLIIDQVILPVLETLGEQWQERADGIAREHFFSAFLRNKIGSRFNHEVSRSQGPAIIIACLPGELHEMGLMLFGLAATARSYRVLYLGPSLPLSQLSPVVRQVKPVALALSGTTVSFDAGMEAEFRELLGQVAIPVYVGGEMAETASGPLQQLGAVPVGRHFRDGLERIIGPQR